MRQRASSTKVSGGEACVRACVVCSKFSLPKKERDFARETLRPSSLVKESSPRQLRFLKQISFVQLYSDLV
jgi:hypothetical protein